MALNPALTTLPSGELFPAPFVTEHFALQRSGIDLELRDLPYAFPNGSKTWKGRGKLILSSIRAVFVADDQRGPLTAFDLPLVYIHRHKFNQPILACNNLAGLVWSILDEGGPSGSLAPISFKLAFSQGGVGTFLPLYHTFHRRAHHNGGQSLPTTSAAVVPSEVVATAMVDPGDPSVLYLAQPVPSAPPVEAPVYAKNYGQDETYESMDR